MIEKIINRYIEDLHRLRENEAEFERYEFIVSDDRKRDENQRNRQRIGVGLLNDLKVPDDYTIVKRLIKEETRHRSANTENYAFEVLYLYYYLLSQFGVIEDIWDFAALKFDGTMDADSGFETGYFLTYGKENLRRLLQKSSHPLKDKIYEKVFSNETEFNESAGQAYMEQQRAYFGLVKPLNDEPRHYLWLREKAGFEESLQNWKKATDLSVNSNAYDYVIFAEYLEDENELEKAMVNYIHVSPKSWLAEKYKKHLRRKRIREILQKITGWFKME